MQIATYAIAWILNRLRREDGQDLIEYALLSGLIAAGLVAVVVLMGDAITDMITNIGYCIDFDDGTACGP